MKSTIVLYHDSCNDGFTCAWIAHTELRDTADYIPVQYGQSAPDVTGKRVYILDFSYKRLTMAFMIAEAASVVVLDHHKSAQEELRDLIVNPGTGSSITFDMTKSGARLTWDHFYPNEEVPWLVNYTEDRDLWRWKLRDSKAINAVISSYSRNFDSWDYLDSLWCPSIGRGDMVTALVGEGNAILRYQSQLVESAVGNARETTLGGYKVLAVNATCLMSEIGEKLAEVRPFGATYFIRPDGKRVWSLRSREGGIDVSIVARSLGGGGHAQAAGFEEEI